MTENYTPEQEKAISELRNRIENDLPQEVCEDKVLLYKFLKARNFNLVQSENMLRKSLQMRKSLQIDTIIDDYKSPEVLEKYVTHKFMGFAKEGYSVSYIAMGTSDGIGIYKSINYFHLTKHVLQLFEMDKQRYKQQTQKLGRNISQSIFIYNMDKLPFAQATNRQSLQKFMRSLIIFQDIYPEYLKKIYVINASVYFTLGFSLVKTILNQAIVDKFRVYGQSGWKEELLRIIDADVLPAFLGGNRTDPDGNPLCRTFLNHGGKVPESYYLVKNIEKTAQKSGMKHIKLERQSSTTVSIDIEKPKLILNWEFETKCYDIGFALIGELENEKPEELLPLYKYETELEPIYGMYRCQKAGKYTIVFDNSYSWLHTKDIYYRTWVTDTEDNYNKVFT